MAYLTRLAQQKDAHLVVRWQSDLLEALEVDAALQQHGVTVYTTALPPGAASGEVTSTGPMTTRRQELRDLLARTELGLSGVDYVIAETGTLVLMARAGQMRGVSLLPPVHVAVARTSQVIATLADFSCWHRQQRLMHSNISPVAYRLSLVPAARAILSCSSPLVCMALANSTSSFLDDDNAR